MLTTALVKTQKFDVIERDRMEAILAEQGMGGFGLTDGYSDLHLSGLGLRGNWRDYAVRNHRGGGRVRRLRNGQEEGEHGR